MEHIIFNISFDSILPILPIILLVILLITLRRRKQLEKDSGLGFGRKGKKDHLWLIIKDYLKKKSLFGYSIDTAHIFDRPNREDLHNYLKKSLIFKYKKEAKEKKEKYIRPTVPNRFEVEDYFDELEKETLHLNKEYLNVNNSNLPRKRYVILFKTRIDSEGVSDWQALEAEILKKPTKEGGNRDVVVINKELDVEKEMTWIFPLLHAREEEKNKKLVKQIRNKK